VRPRRIEVEIGTLVLEGLSARHTTDVVSAIRGELPDLLRAEGRKTTFTPRRIEAHVVEIILSRLRR